MAADPAAWTADVPAVLDALEAPVLRAFYLVAVQEAADQIGALPGGNLVHLHTPEPEPGPGPAPAQSLEHSAQAALFGLLAAAWTRPAGPTGLGALLPAALDRLRALAEPLAHPQLPSPRPARGPPGPRKPARLPAVRHPGRRRRRARSGRWSASSTAR
ncbi:hypothetical protein ABR737_00015 [Streptomyces sp. Edi2]|uniref:hypothetical protein n=1 Tax=Streptomyces sp. Edi2 TaxID=3162528 RepID=UPI00330591A4